MKDADTQTKNLPKSQSIKPISISIIELCLGIWHWV